MLKQYHILSIYPTSHVKTFNLFLARGLHLKKSHARLFNLKSSIVYPGDKLYIYYLHRYMPEHITYSLEYVERMSVKYDFWGL